MQRFDFNIIGLLNQSLNNRWEAVGRLTCQPSVRLQITLNTLLTVPLTSKHDAKDDLQHFPSVPVQISSYSLTKQVAASNSSNRYTSAGPVAPGRTPGARPGALRAHSACVPERRSRDPAAWKNLIAGARPLPCWGPVSGAGARRSVRRSRCAGVPGTSVWRRGPAVSGWLTLGVWGVSWPNASRFASRLVWCSAKLIKCLGQLAGSGLQRDAAGLLAKLHLHRAKSADALTLYVERSRFLWEACYHRGGRIGGVTKHGGNMCFSCNGFGVYHVHIAWAPSPTTPIGKARGLLTKFPCRSGLRAQNVIWGQKKHSTV